MELKFKKFNENAIVPKKHLDAAGYDLFLPEYTEIPPHATGYKIPIGLGMQAPKGYAGIIEARSSTNTKTLIRVCTGIIDNDYTGEICVVADNLGNVNYKLPAGKAIAQMYLQEVPNFEVMLVEELEETERGEKGFGSSGK